MNKFRKMGLQSIVILLVIIFLLVLFVAGIIMGVSDIKQPKGEYITVTDGRILTEAAGIAGGFTTDNYVTYEDVMQIFGANGLQTEVLKYENKYSDSHYVLKEDWYYLYDKYLQIAGLSELITKAEVVSLGAGGQIRNSEGNVLGDNRLVTTEKEYEFMSDEIRNYRFVPVTVYQKDEVLLTVVGKSEERLEVPNVWLMEMTSDCLMFFINNYEILYDDTEKLTELQEKLSGEAREQVADLVFENGRLSSVDVKSEKLSGRILGIDNENIHVEGIGTLKLSEDMRVYQIYDKLVSKTVSDLRVGYEFTDFVVRDGILEACLITRDEAMQNIRVLINNSGYGGRMHEKVTATSDTDFIVRYGNYDNLQEQEFKAGTVVEFGMDSAYFMSDRIAIIPKALTGKVELFSVERNQGTPWYRGYIEVIKTENGLVVINEVLLEEYLYSVVPSEMPASYPLEALKAQAIGARTYAYRNMIKTGIPEYGAHLDDSTAFQVYNNINENVETTKAVRETKGQLLYSGEELVEAYYYSTSCGVGTTTDIWQSGQPAISYLKAKRISVSGNDENFNKNTLKDEEVFKLFIENKFETDYDYGEGWYRWSYTTEKLDASNMAERMQARQKNNSNLILKKEDDEYVTSPVDDFKEIYDITIGERGMGGVLDSLFIHTDCGTYKIVGEYNIRYVLNDGATKVVKQDGIESASPTLLPSAFFVMDVYKEDNCVSGYSLLGGGFGHGVGMSQNAAKNMALKGMRATDILMFFYDGSEIREIY